VVIGASSAELLIRADSDSDALVSATGGALGAVAIAAFLGEAAITGSTLAYVGQGVTLNVGELDVEADAHETADALTVPVGAGLISGQGAKAIALFNSSTEAFTGARAGVAPSGDPTTIIHASDTVLNPSADGTIVVDAQSHQEAIAVSGGGGAGLIQVAVMLPEATAGGLVRAYVGEGTFTNDPVDTFGGYGVVEVPNYQRLLNYICENGYEHHVSVNRSHYGRAVYDALANYKGWEVYHHGV
jgi:hypothetical protein